MKVLWSQFYVFHVNIINTHHLVVRIRIFLKKLFSCPPPRPAPPIRGQTACSLPDVKQGNNIFESPRLLYKCMRPKCQLISVWTPPEPNVSFRAGFNRCSCRSPDRQQPFKKAVEFRCLLVLKSFFICEKSRLCRCIAVLWRFGSSCLCEVYFTLANRLFTCL